MECHNNSSTLWHISCKHVESRSRLSPIKIMLFSKISMKMEIAKIVICWLVKFVPTLWFLEVNVLLSWGLIKTNYTFIMHNNIRSTKLMSCLLLIIKMNWKILVFMCILKLNYDIKVNHILVDIKIKMKKMISYIFMTCYPQIITHSFDIYLWKKIHLYIYIYIKGCFLSCVAQIWRKWEVNDKNYIVFRIWSWYIEKENWNKPKDNFTWIS